MWLGACQKYIETYLKGSHRQNLRQFDIKKNNIIVNYNTLNEKRISKSIMALKKKPTSIQREKKWEKF